jgi:hypothetical protein
MIPRVRQRLFFLESIFMNVCMFVFIFLLWGFEVQLTGMHDPDGSSLWPTKRSVEAVGFATENNNNNNNNKIKFNSPRSCRIPELENSESCT